MTFHTHSLQKGGKRKNHLYECVRTLVLHCLSPVTSVTNGRWVHVTPSSYSGKFFKKYNWTSMVAICGYNILVQLCSIHNSISPSLIKINNYSVSVRYLYLSTNLGYLQRYPIFVIQRYS